MNMSMAVRTWPKATAGVAGLGDVQQPPRETIWAFPLWEQERGEHVERRNTRLRLGSYQLRSFDDDLKVMRGDQFSLPACRAIDVP